MPRKETLASKILKRITRKKSVVLLREDFSDLGEYDQVGRVLRQLVTEGKLLKIGYGLYAKTRFSPYNGEVLPQAPLPTLAKEALRRLGIQTFPSRLHKAYNAGLSTQVPTGRVIGVKEKINRKIGYDGVYVFFEKTS